jgi:FixJ family two-component response regulator
MLQVTPIVFVVDDDVSVRESLELLIRCEGWLPAAFASAQEFLACPRALVPSCLVLDVSLPGLSDFGGVTAIFTVVIIREDAEFVDAVLQVFDGVVDVLVLKPGG